MQNHSTTYLSTKVQRIADAPGKGRVFFWIVHLLQTRAKVRFELAVFASIKAGSEG